MNSRGVEAIVLAAGQSGRMGSPKPFLPLGESTFLQVVLGRLAQAGFDRPLVIANPAHTEMYERLVERRARVIFNPRVDDGMFSSLRLGLRSLPPDTRHALVCLVDMPAVEADTHHAIAETAVANPGRIVIATHQGERGHPVVWPRSLFGVVANWSGERGAREVLHAHGDLVLEVEVPDTGVVRDVDTPEDYRLLLAGDDPRPPLGGGDSGLA